MRPRVVVTGVGAACAVGRGAEPVFEALLAGRDGVGPLKAFDSSQHRVHVAAECRFFGAGERSVHSLGRLVAEEARRASGQADAAFDPTRVGLACGILGGDATLVEARMLAAPGERSVGITPESAPWYAPDATARALAHEYGVEGPVATLANACSAGNHAIATGSDWIRGGRADSVLAGGLGLLSFTAFTHFDNLRSLDPDYCRPFDRFRRGLVLGEGAAWLVLEEREAARRRGAPLLAEVLGYGISCDAHNVAAPHPEARGAIAAMRDALADARLDADAVDYVSAHGTGTRMNDPIESLAMRRVFGERGRRVPCSSIKSMIGHTLGAASAIEAVVCCLAIRDGRVPPTIHYSEPDPDCDVDCVPNQARELEVRCALNNAFAFGGNNCAVVFGAAT